MRNNVSKPLDRACARRVLPERNMRSHLVIIDGIFRKDPSKVLRVERNQMIVHSFSWSRELLRFAMPQSTGNCRQSGQWRSESFIGGGRKSVRSSLFVDVMVAARYQCAAQKLPRQTRRRRQAGDQGPGDCRSHAGHGSEKILFLTRADRKVIHLRPNGSGDWKDLSDLGQALLVFCHKHLNPESARV